MRKKFFLSLCFVVFTVSSVLSQGRVFNLCTLIFEDGELDISNVLLSRNKTNNTYLIEINNKIGPQSIIISKEIKVANGEYKYQYDAVLSNPKYPSLKNNYKVSTVKPLSYFLAEDYKYDENLCKIKIPIFMVSKRSIFITEDVEYVTMLPLDINAIEKKEQEKIKNREQELKEKFSILISCEDFSEELALVCIDPMHKFGEDSFGGYVHKAYGYINKQGEYVIEPQYNMAFSFAKEGFALVQKYKDFFGQNYNIGEYEFIDKTGKNAFNQTFIYARSFSEGFAAVKNEKGKWGFIDTKGNLVIPYKYDDVGYFKERLAKVYIGEYSEFHKRHIDGNWGYIDTSGKEIIIPQFSDAYDFSEGLAYVVNGNNKGFIKKEGQYAFLLRYAGCKLIQSFVNSVAIFEWGDNYLYIDTKGKEKIDHRKWKNFNGFYEGLASTETDKYWMYGFINEQQKWIIKQKFDIAGNFHEGLAKVGMNSSKSYHDKKYNWGFIDKTGAVVINSEILKKETELKTQAPYDDVSDFSGGLAFVKTQGKYGIIDKKGNWIVQPIFSEYKSFNKGIARVKSSDRKGWNYIDSKGNILFPNFQ